MSAKGTCGFYSVLRQTTLLVDGEPLRRERVNIANKITRSQRSNLLTSSSFSILLWAHADDAMKPVKCISVMGLEKLKFDKIMPKA